MSKFNMIMKNYPRYTEIASSNLLKELFSGIEDWVLNETNTCAIRVSAALNEAGVLIQRGVANKKHYIKGRGWKTHDKKYDYIVDAIDLVTPKLDLIEFATNSKIPIISCMGTGNKINPAQFKVADIKKTSVCPLAKIIRKELKKRRINKLKVVYSDETPRKPLNLDGGREKNKNVGSISFVPPVAGMLLASEVIKDICKL